jgi:3-oxoacyl-[acyl-carrier-protein] synthase II
MQKKRVVVTGLGVVSCLGSDVEEYYQKLLQGESGVSTIEKFDAAEFSTKIAGEIKNFDVEDYMDKKQSRRVDPFISYSMVAGKKALENASINLDTIDKKRAGIIIGSGMGGMDVFYNGVNTLREKGHKRLTPFFVPYIITNMGGALLAMDLGFMGPNYSISTACATANNSIYSAAEHIRNGNVDIMLCGGAESPINPIGVAGFVAIKALSTQNEQPKQASKPWDKKRDGFVMGEGAGVLVLESLEHALARGANIICEYKGGAINCDAYHMTAPREDGLGVSMCIEEALKDANIEPDKVDHINAHGTSTPVGDMAEIDAIKNVFGSHAKNIKVNSTKSIIGHCLGASGGLEAIATIKAIETGKIHPTINIDDPEEGLSEVSAVLNKAQDHKVSVALSNSFGFGGHNAVLVFGEYKE